MELENDKEQRYVYAKKRVEELKSFYSHLAVFIVINLFISIRKVIQHVDDGLDLESAIFEYSTYSLWLFWGFGLAFHALKVFGFIGVLGKDWEDRKIKEEMDKFNRKF